MDLVRHHVKWTYADTHTAEHVVVQIDEWYPERGIIRLYDQVTGKEIDKIGGGGDLFSLKCNAP